MAATDRSVCVCVPCRAPATDRRRRGRSAPRRGHGPRLPRRSTPRRRVGIPPQGDLALLDSEVAQRLLAANIPARLAFTASDGTPRVLPINFVFNGTEVVMCGFARSHKNRALRARPDVAITIDTNDAPPEVLLIRGRAEVTESQGLLAEYAEAMRKGGDPQVEGYLSMLAERKPLMERIAVRPNWVGVLDFQTSIGGDVRAGGRIRRQWCATRPASRSRCRAATSRWSHSVRAPPSLRVVRSARSRAGSADSSTATRVWPCGAGPLVSARSAACRRWAGRFRRRSTCSPRVRRAAR